MKKSVQVLRVLRGYRRALRATDKVFAGDENINVARRYVRDQFRAHVGETDESVIEERIEAIDEAVKFALENVVQASPNEKGHLEVEVSSNSKDDHIILESPNEGSGGGCSNRK